MSLGQFRQIGLREKTLGTPILILPNMQAASTEHGWEQLNPNQALAQPGDVLFDPSILCFYYC